MDISFSLVIGIIIESKKIKESQCFDEIDKETDVTLLALKSLLRCTIQKERDSSLRTLVTNELISFG